MNKKLIYFGGAILALALVAYVGLTLFLGSVVKAGVNSFAPKLTQTKVELAGAHISPLTGSGTLSGLYVGNPNGWNSEKAFYLGKIHVEVSPFSVLGDHVVVREVFIDQPEFVYETKLVASNIGDLLKNIEAAIGGGKDTAPTAKNGRPIKFEVKHFRLQNGRVTLGVGATAVTMPMPPIELNDLGTKEGGITSEQLVVAVMRSVSSSVVTATTQAAGKVGTTMGAAAAESAKKAGEGLKKLLGGK
ncbi:MAG: hypothetical protein PHQ04_10320 [Opitutaceae bacterium]|nr:hypothetical protein [Opitutaceae bacterium]